MRNFQYPSFDNEFVHIDSMDGNEEMNFDSEVVEEDAVHLKVKPSLKPVALNLDSEDVISAQDVEESICGLDSEETENQNVVKHVAQLSPNSRKKVIYNFFADFRND